MVEIKDTRRALFTLRAALTLRPDEPLNTLRAYWADGTLLTLFTSSASGTYGATEIVGDVIDVNICGRVIRVVRVRGDRDLDPVIPTISVAVVKEAQTFSAWPLRSWQALTWRSALTLRALKRVRESVIVRVTRERLCVVRICTASDLEPVCDAIGVRVLLEINLSREPLRSNRSLNALFTSLTTLTALARYALLASDPTRSDGANKEISDPVVVVIDRIVEGVAHARARGDLDPVVPPVKVGVIIEGN